MSFIPVPVTVLTPGPRRGLSQLRPDGTASPRGEGQASTARSPAVRPAERGPGILGAEVGAGLAGELRGVARLEAVDAPAQLLQLGDAGVQPRPRGPQPLGQVRTDGLVRL